MHLRVLTLASLIAIAGVSFVSAQSATPAETPAASASPAKHRSHKAKASPSPAAETAAPLGAGETGEHGGPPRGFRFRFSRASWSKEDRVGHREPFGRSFAGDVSRGSEAFAC